MNEFGSDGDLGLGFEEVVHLLFGGPPPETTVPSVVITPAYLALEFLTETETNYALFTEYLRARVPDTVEIAGVPTLEETKRVVNALRDADPTLKYLS